jgi:hypothetical protein
MPVSARRKSVTQRPNQKNATPNAGLTVWHGSKSFPFLVAEKTDGSTARLAHLWKG